VAGAPFFIVGCPRSGTTLLRDLLRLAPGAFCPAETHFYSTIGPFGSTRYINHLSSNLILKMHRKQDGVREQRFARLLKTSRNRAQLQEGYAALYAEAAKAPQDYSWFDKTPQNIYGLPLILADFPSSPVIFLVRHPLNSVASIYSGMQIKGLSLKASISIWNESWQIMKMTPNPRVILLSYEELTSDCEESLLSLGRMLGDPYRNLEKSCTQTLNVSPEQNKYKQVLSPIQIKKVLTECAEGMSLFGYNDSPEMTRLLTADEISSSDRNQWQYLAGTESTADRLLKRIKSTFRVRDSNIDKP
jgi:hypothetical protein